MTRDEAAAKLAELNAQIDSARTVPAVQGGASGAFADIPQVETKPRGEALATQPGIAQSAAEFAAPMAGSMVGASRAVALAAPLEARAAAIHPLLGAATTGGAALVGAFAGGTTGQLTLEGAKRALSLPGAPDSIDEAAKASLQRGSEEALGEVWGRGAGKAIEYLRIMPFRRALTSESADLFKTQGERLRAAYEEAAGTALLEDTRARFNPGRIFKPVGSELDDAAVVKRLKERGLDPVKAREVALTGGMLPSQVEEATFRRFWRMSENTQITGDLQYNVARSKLAHIASLEDMGTQLAEQLDPTQLGAAVHAAIRGDFDTLNAARETSMNNIRILVPEDFRLDFSKLKSPPAGTTGKAIVDDLLKLGKNPTFDQVQAARTNLGVMMHDRRLTDEQRAEATKLAGFVDKHTAAGMPDNSRALYRKWSRADDSINEQGFNDAFVRGLLNNPKSPRRYADAIVGMGDVDNMQALETALAKHPDGPRLLSAVKGGIGERLFRTSVNSAGVIEPDKLLKALGSEHGVRYGQTFLTATLGPEYVANYRKYAQVMSQINEASANLSVTLAAGQGLGVVAAGLAGYQQGASPSSMLPIAGALFSGRVVQKALMDPRAAKLLIRTAESFVTGHSPRTTSRLAGRVLEQVGLAPEDLFQGMNVLPQEQASNQIQEQRAMRGIPPAASGGAVPQWQ